MTVDSRDSKDLNPSDLSDDQDQRSQEQHDPQSPIANANETETDVEMTEELNAEASPSHSTLNYSNASSSPTQLPPATQTPTPATRKTPSRTEFNTTTTSKNLQENPQQQQRKTHTPDAFSIEPKEEIRTKQEFDDEDYEDATSHPPRITPTSSAASGCGQMDYDDDQEEQHLAMSTRHASSSPPSILPKLRLNAFLASDPALKPDAKDLKAMHEETQTKKRAAAAAAAAGHIPPPPALKKQEDLESLLPTATLVEPILKSAPAPAVDMPPRVKVFMCMPCGIVFSSPSTLEAHQAYYCSHRSKDMDDEGAAAGLSADKSSSLNVNTGGAAGTTASSVVIANAGEPTAKTLKTGKQYACTQCSYSADKKVSLNRHMRMHQSSPAHSANSASNGAAAGGLGVLDDSSSQIDRYCSECDIRFNNVKTYRAHKQSYCSSRRTDGQLTPKLEVATSTASKTAGSGGSVSPQTRTKTPNPAMVAAAAAAAAVAAAASLQPPPQPFLALPTNPILIIPYSLIRAASLIPGPLTTASSGIVNPENTCFTLDNGALKPLATALNMNTSSSSPATGGISTSNATLNSVKSSGNGHQIPIVDSTRQQQHISNEAMLPLLAEKIAASRNAEMSEATPKRHESALRETAPLDLSLSRRSPLAAALQRQRMRPSSAFLDSEYQQRLDMDTILEAGKENLSMDDSGSITPEQIVCAPSLPNSPSMSPSPKRRAISPRSGGAGSTSSMSPPASVATTSTTAALAAAAAASNHLLDHLPLRSMLNADIALKLSESNIMNPLLAKQNLELALKLSAAAAAVSSSTATAGSVSNSAELVGKSTLMSLPASSSGSSSGQPQIYVKQGVSKCKECNIVFCKYENYLAHKQHYCSARNQDVTGSDGTGADIKHSGTPPMAAGPTTVDTTPVAYQQLICAACGIKYTSLDNLRAHQNYYCPKGGGAAAAAAAAAAVNADAAQLAQTKEKCSKCKTIHEFGLPCPIPAALQQQQPSQLINTSALTNASTASNQNCYKCPVCDVVSLTANESRKHMETHGSVKAFRCSICRYKGNTLRGMRTHIRMHFDKKTTDFNEEHYMSCILEDDGLEIPSAATLSQEHLVQQLAAVQQQQLQQHLQQQQQQVYNCEICNYSSSYKGNVLRHMKLMHPQAIINSPSISPDAGDLEADAASRTSSLNGTGGDSGSHGFTIKTEPMENHVVPNTHNSGSTQNMQPSTVRSGSSLENLHDNNISPIPTTNTSNDFISHIKSEPMDITIETTQMAVTHPPPPLSSPSTTAGALPPPPHQQLNTTPDENSPASAGSNLNQKYCQTCDISFNYMKTYLAHKQYYCKNNMRRPEAPTHHQQQLCDSPTPNAPVLPTAVRAVHSPSAAILLQKNKENLQQEAAI